MLRKLLYLKLILIIAAAGCAKQVEDGPDGAAVSKEPPRALAGAPPSHSVVTNYVLRGVVKKVEKELEHVRMAHEAIPGFMDAMTMRFAYKDQKVLELLRPGDHVEGTLRVEKSGDVVQAYELLGLTVKQAAGPAAAPDISRNKARVGEPIHRLEIGEPVPDFTMTSQDGNPVKLSELRGNVVVLTFIYTRCPLPDFCPLMDKKFAELAGRIDAIPGRARRIRLISLSFDPDHDTPDLLRKHAQFRGATPPLWSYAVASHSELARIGVPLGLFYQPGDNEIAHNLCTAIIGPTGNLARLEIGTQSNKWDISDFQKTIYSLLGTTQK